MTGGSEQWEGRFDKHHVLCSIYPRAIKGGSGHNDVWRTGAEVGGGAVSTHKHEHKHIDTNTHTHTRINYCMIAHLQRLQVHKTGKTVVSYLLNSVVMKMSGKGKAHM